MKLCPQCGTLITLRFPLHECPPRKEEPVSDPVRADTESAPLEVEISWDATNRRWRLESWPPVIGKQVLEGRIPGIRKHSAYHYTITTTDLGKVLRLLVDRGCAIVLW